MNLLYNVGKSSEIQPAMISLEYKGNPDSDEFIALVGKGVIYDTGGLNIKLQMMKIMFSDKCGACDVLATFQAVVELGLKVNVVCALGVAENSISSNSYRPSDIIKTMAGFTVEVDNTDAEGRLAMASAMTWVQKTYKVRELVQVATLTGGQIAALGMRTAAVFSNDDELVETLEESSELAQAPVWHMPIPDEFDTAIVPPHADYENFTPGPKASSSGAAAFLRLFIEEGVKWAHIDIAGPSLVMSPYGPYT